MEAVHHIGDVSIFEALLIPLPRSYYQSTGGIQITFGPEILAGTDYWAQGYAFESVYENSGSTEEFTAYAELFISNPNHGEHGIQPAIFSGTIGFTCGVASSKFGDYAGTTNAAGLTVDQSLDKNGKIFGTGELYSENVRTAGLAPTDFKNVSIRFSRFVGHVAGEEGKEMRVIGVGRGSYADQTGTIREIRASIEISGGVPQ